MVARRPEKTTLEIHSRPRLLQFRRQRGGGGVLEEVELESTKILWPGGVLHMEEEKHMRMTKIGKFVLFLVAARAIRKTFRNSV